MGLEMTLMEWRMSDLIYILRPNSPFFFFFWSSNSIKGLASLDLLGILVYIRKVRRTQIHHYYLEWCGHWTPKGTKLIFSEKYTYFLLFVRVPSYPYTFIYNKRKDYNTNLSPQRDTVTSTTFSDTLSCLDVPISD